MCIIKLYGVDTSGGFLHSYSTSLGLDACAGYEAIKVVVAKLRLGRHHLCSIKPLSKCQLALGSEGRPLLGTSIICCGRRCMNWLLAQAVVFTATTSDVRICQNLLPCLYPFDLDGRQRLLTPAPTAVLSSFAKACCFARN